ncbi:MULTISPECIES: hypothetical protein [unclassified Pseudoalteromonas]|uniref:hypothetical protein n=1 Tax=unclassified Pseudoalteromonas TaxID=194690 RepID=UPI003014C624
MFVYDIFGMSIGALVIWGFLMATLLHFFFNYLKLKRTPQLLSSALILFISYFTSDMLVMSYENSSIIFGVFSLFDLVTLTLVILVAKWLSKSDGYETGTVYVFAGLAINTSLFFFMFLDTYLLENVEPWFLWYFYSYTVVIVDFIMVAALLLNKDFLRIRYTVNRMMAPS